jgi:chromosome segregation ATPase
MSGLRDYLERRRDEIREQMAPLEAANENLRAQLSANNRQLMDLASELSEVEKAIRAITGRKVPLDTSITIKDAVLRVLRDTPEGLAAHEILIALNERFFDGRLLRTSMSPQLARLRRDDRKIIRRNGKYFLA